MLKQIGNNCKPGDKVYFCYTHHLNSRSSFEQQIGAEFVRYVKQRENTRLSGKVRKVVIQCFDRDNPTVTEITKVFKDAHLKRKYNSWRQRQ